MPRHRERRKPFSEVVESVPDSGLLGVTPFPGLAKEREFEDADKVTWTRRGSGALNGKALGKRLLNERVLVWYEYGTDVTVVAPSDRERFWQQAQDRMQESVHSEFQGYEFKSASGVILLVVQERC